MKIHVKEKASPFAYFSAICSSRTPCSLISDALSTLLRRCDITPALIIIFCAISFRRSCIHGVKTCHGIIKIQRISECTLNSREVPIHSIQKNEPLLDQHFSSYPVILLHLAPPLKQHLYHRICLFLNDHFNLAVSLPGCSFSFNLICNFGMLGSIYTSKGSIVLFGG